MLRFLLVLSIFVLSYGVISQSIKFGNVSNAEISKHADLSVLHELFYKPYWQLYGEMTFLGDSEPADEGSCFNGLGENSENLPRCARLPEGISWVSVIYMLLVNVLLLNLLIALFASTYAIVEAQSATVWKVQRADLVVEYRDKAILPSPFNLFHNIKYLAYNLIWKTFKQSLKNKVNHEDFKSEIGGLAGD